jgi:hypothetical protein
VLPAPAAPLGVDELLLDGEELEAPPLALSFFCTSIEVDEELEPEPEGVALDDGEDVVPEAELEEEPGVVVAPEPDGEVVEDEELEPAGPREAPLSDLLQPAIMAPPKARETARARVESFIWPPWLGYGKEAARIGPRMLRSHPGCLGFTQFFIVGAVSALFGPALSPLRWKSRCWSACLGSTWPCCGLLPSRFSAMLGVPMADEVVPADVVAPEADTGPGDTADDGLSVFGDGVVDVLRSQPAAKASEMAATRVSNLMCAPDRE